MRGSVKEVLQPVLVRIHHAGWPFIGLFAGFTVILGLIWSPFWVPGAILTLWCVYFFRDPDRVTPTRPGLVISPADGIVQMVTAAAPPPELEMGQSSRPRISIFMNVFDCHVNRSPIDGQITGLAYKPGRFLNASLDEASERNERQSMRVTMRDNRDVACVQIAGLVARRILCSVSPDQPIRAGERIGMIRFGSRVDIYLPDGVAPLVVAGQKMIAGETVLADLKATEPPREGEVR